MSKQQKQAPNFERLISRVLYRICLATFSVLGLICNVFSQVHLNARVLTTEEGLSDNRITCLYKDRKGYVWIGTQHGLNRYDGQRITVYKPGPGNSISNEVINDVAEDLNGNIWVATMNGLNTLNTATNSWTVMLPLPTSNAADIPSNLIWDISIDSTNRVWIASDVQEFCYYDIGKKSFRFYDWPAFVKTVPQFSYSTYNSIKRFVFKSASEVLLASNKALVSLNINSGDFTYLGGEYRSDVWDLYHDSLLNITYASIEGSKLVKHHHPTGTTSISAPAIEVYPSKNFTTSLLQNRWMAAQNGYLNIRPDGSATLNEHIPQLSTSLLPGAVAAIMQADGVRWVGGFNGVSYYDTRNPALSFLPLIPASDKSGWNTMGGTLFSATNQEYFVCAADDATVFIISQASGEVRKLTHDLKGRRFRHCNTLKEDRDKTVWLLTDDAVYKYNRMSKGFQRFSTPNGNEDVVFRHMVQDANGDYWFASFHKGVYYYQQSTKSFITPSAPQFSNVITATSLLADDRHHSVWIGTYSIGFYRYDLRNKQLTVFAETNVNPSFAALNLVNDIAQDSAGHVWAATQAGGIFKFTVQQDNSVQVRQFNMQNGLTENSFAALAANDSILWALSGKGLTGFSIHHNALAVSRRPRSNFSSFVSDVRYPHHIAINQQQQVVAAVGGGLLFVSERGRQSALTVPLTVTGAFINERAVKQLPSTLSPDENNLRFQYSNLYYGSSLAGLTTYYRLNGWDEHWMPADAAYEAVYQNLPAGKYRFYVVTLNSGGKVVGSTASTAFEIKAPFYRHWWFVLPLVLLGLAAVYGIVKWRVSQVRRKARLEQQLTELEAKALRAQMNPHFIFNCLNAIQELIVTENVDAAYNYLAKFSKLLRLVLNHSEQSTITIEEEITVLQLYLELESLRFRKSFDYDIEVNSNVDTDNTLIPPLLLQPYIENALWHGLMLKEGEKILKLRMSRHADQLHLEVEDNGIGRARSAEIKQQQLGAAQFTSKGLKLSQHRLGLLEVDGRKGHVNIEDLYCDGNPCGTRVVITLPLMLS